MKSIVLRLLKMVGLKKLISIAWNNFIYPELKKYVKKTESVEWDDNALEFLNGIVNYIIKNKL